MIFNALTYVEYGKYFMSDTGFLIFSRLQSTSEDMKKNNPVSRVKKYYIFNVKSIEFSVYYNFFGSETCFFQTLDTAYNT